MALKLTNSTWLASLGPRLLNYMESRSDDETTELGLMLGIVVLVWCVGMTAYHTCELYLGIFFRWSFAKIKDRIYRKEIAEQKIQDAWMLAMALVPGTPLTKSAADEIGIYLPFLKALPSLGINEDQKKTSSHRQAF